MSVKLLTNASDVFDYTMYALIGGIIAGFIIDYTDIPSVVTLVLGLILMGMDLGVKGTIADILEGIGFALTSLGVYDIIKNKITINAS